MKFKKSIRVVVAVASVALLWWTVMFCIVPRPLFDVPYSTLLYSRDSMLLGARIASDGQWRFPASDSVPARFEAALLTYEDKRFYSHPGIDPLAVARAVKLNMSGGRVVSGGSTVTMQLARQARGRRDRNLWQKAVEAMYALFIECTHSKSEILAMYVSHAPFGGNVVGLEAASWRYFGRPADELSWAENAVLAVLPNSPSLIHPGRNRSALKHKRDRLLDRMEQRGVIDATECSLAKQEPLPDAPLSLPDGAPHLLERLAAERRGERMVSSLDGRLQRLVSAMVDRYGALYASSNRVFNAAALVADVETGEVLAYAGNVTGSSHGGAVDIITSERSSGSILKPLLYAGMLHDGLILPGTLVADTPLKIGGFAPQNYNRRYYGAVPARQAVTQSLNVPLVRMLSKYNTGRFMELLDTLGMSTLHYPEGHYGASIILGGAECTLWDVCGIYASSARILAHFSAYDCRYDSGDIHPLTPFVSGSGRLDPLDGRLTGEAPVLSAAALWFAFEAMSELGRPEEEAEWQQFASMKRVAWKTGTSYGGRDAWAVGLTPRYVVGVWVGNASGEGRPGLTGVSYAGPLLFDIFSLLGGGEWFDEPLCEMETAEICPVSGHKASPLCPVADSVTIPRSGINTTPCPYHRRVHLSSDGRWRVDSSCESIDRMVSASWFVLPPAQEYYYRQYHADYRPLPPLGPGCAQETERRMDIIYPEHGDIITLPRGFDGVGETMVMQAAHVLPDETVYWYIDDEFIGATVGTHEMTAAPDPGEHLLSLTDSRGNRRKIVFTVR